MDDGLATGATMLAAARDVAAQGPEKTIVAVPAASPDACEEFRKHVDQIVCAETPEHFRLWAFCMTTSRRHPMKRSGTCWSAPAVCTSAEEATDTLTGLLFGDQTRCRRGKTKTEPQGSEMQLIRERSGTDSAAVLSNVLEERCLQNIARSGSVAKRQEAV